MRINVGATLVAQNTQRVGNPTPTLSFNWKNKKGKQLWRSC